MLYALVPAIVAMLGFAPASLASPQFYGLGDLPGGTDESFATAVSADGSTVVGYSPTAAGIGAFRWTQAAGIEELPDLPAGTSRASASAVSADGSVIVGSAQIVDPLNGSLDRAVQWRSSGVEELALLPGWSHVEHRATDVSADGSLTSVVALQEIEGGYNWATYLVHENGSIPWMLDYVSVPPWASQVSEPVIRAVSADASVMVGELIGYAPLNAALFFSNSGSEVEEIAIGDSWQMSVSDLSSDGSTAVGLLWPEAWRWTSEGGRVGLGLIAGDVMSDAMGVSGDGQWIVGWSFGGVGQRATIWDEDHGLRLLQPLIEGMGIVPTGWTLEVANAISDDGTVITGNGIDPNGDSQAFVIYLDVPLGQSAQEVPALGAAGFALLASLLALGLRASLT